MFITKGKWINNRYEGKFGFEATFSIDVSPETGPKKPNYVFNIGGKEVCGLWLSKAGSSLCGSFGMVRIVAKPSPKDKNEINIMMFPKEENAYAPNGFNPVQVQGASPVLSSQASSQGPPF